MITKEDLETLDLSEIKESVILPGRAFVHQLDAERRLVDLLARAWPLVPYEPIGAVEA